MAFSFRAYREETESPSNEHFELHRHDEYEIYLFFEGDTQYIVEGSTYHLQPNDVVVIRKNEMHRAFHNSAQRYSRFVLFVSPAFFRENGCEEYEAQFLKTGLGNRLDARTVMSSGLLDAFERLWKYTDHLKKMNTPIAKGIVTEILYLLNETRVFAKADVTDFNMERIVSYLNEHYTESITLSMLGEIGYLSVYHLCRQFRKITGLTVHQYITKKRISLVRELVSTKSISEAASLAGFSSYTSFYHAYKKEYGVPPKSELKNEIR